MIVDNNLNVQEPILEYFDRCNNKTITIREKQLYFKPDKNYWLFPGIPRKININVNFWLPHDCIGLLTKNADLSPNIQLDTVVLYNRTLYISFIQVVNRGCIPIKLSKEKIIADLSIIPKTEYHILNAGGQS